MDKETRAGMENLEKTVTAEERTEQTREETSSETVQSEELRYENADSIYE